MFPTVYVVDDDDRFRESLCMLVASLGYETCGCRDAQEFRTRFVADDAGCVLLDVRMPRVGGLDLLQELAASGDSVPIIMMSGHADVPTATRALLSGASDFLEKPFGDQELLDRVNAAVRRSEEGRAARRAREERRARLASLSERERQVLRGLVAGATSAEIGEELGLSRRTVEMHRARIMDRLGVGSFAELIRLALDADAASP